MSADFTDAEAVDRLVSHAQLTIGLSKGDWNRWPGGWPGDIESALLDAVFSARATYRTRRGRGVRKLLELWQDKRTRTSFTLDALKSEIVQTGIDQWSDAFGSRQHSPSRPRTASRGPSKAAAVVEAAERLVNLDVHSASDITDDVAKQARSAIMATPGIGYATTNYFFMLLGTPGVKPDRMIHRFLEDALGRSVGNERAEDIVTQAALRVGSQPNDFEHAIWKYESDRAADRAGRKTKL